MSAPSPALPTKELALPLRFSGTGVATAQIVDANSLPIANASRAHADAICTACNSRAWLLEALEQFVAAAKSWHNFHHGSATVQCDWLCECIPAGESALRRARGEA